MTSWAYLFLFVLGILIIHYGSYFTIKYEDDTKLNVDPTVYTSMLTVTFSGLFLSVHALIKMWKEANEQIKEVS